MRRLASFLIAAVVTVAAMAQTLNVEVGSVTYQIPAADAGSMLYADGTSLTIADNTYAIADITRIYVDDAVVGDTAVYVTYDGNAARVLVDGRIAKYVSVAVSGAHVSVMQSAEVADDTTGEITYSLSGSSTDGEFYLSGSYKATVELRGLTLTNPTGAAINIQDGKRIAVSVKNGTVNTLSDGSASTQKAAFVSKGHTEFKGKGTLTVSSAVGHGIWSGEYLEMKNCTINVAKAAKDGINCNEYFLMESGTLTIAGVGSDGIQCSIDGTEGTGTLAGHDGEDSGSIYIEGGTLDLTLTGDAAKGLKADGDISISAGSVTVTQSGGIEVEGSDISYPTSIKADGNISVTGGTVNITNTGAGGKGMSAEGTLTIDEASADVSTNVTIKANGKGGTAETTGGDDSGEQTSSYKVYVSLPTSGGGGMGPGGSSNAWTTLYLYESDGTLVQQLTSTVSKSSGYSTVTFYYYDFKAATDGTYYFKSADYTSRGGGWGGGSGTTYAIQSATFSAPTSGTDIYYSITNSYSTSGTTRTYSLTNVTSTYGGSSDISEDEGTAYNAIGMKADGNLTINAGTVNISNSGAMSKSIKSKATTTINGGTTTLTPSGAMQVINNDASYSSGVKTADFVQNGGTLKITASGNASRGITATTVTTNGGTLTIDNSGAGVQGTADSYTAKGIKADTSLKLLGGTITITMSGTGGKGIKSSGTYTQGVSGGDGPTLTVTTKGSSLGGSSGGGWGQQSSGSSAKGIKVQGTIYIYGGTSEIYTSTNGAEGLESKTAIYIEGGKHYFKCYDDCINSSGNIYFNGGVTVCYGYGNDSVDSNAGRTGAITIGNGVVFAYTTQGSPEEGLDCDNNSYIQITGTGIGISAGGAQGGGGGGWGGSSSSSTISNAKQGYAFVTSSISYTSGRYYTLANASGTNLVTYSFEGSCSSTLALFTATGMVKGSSYTVKYSTSAPTDATTAWHGLYLGSSAAGTTSVTSFTAQ